MAGPVNVWDYEKLAEEKLDANAHAYFAGGAGDEVTLRESVEAWRRYRFVPRVLRELRSIDGVILGGIGDAFGALAGGVLLGLVTEWSTLFIDARGEVTYTKLGPDYCTGVYWPGFKFEEKIHGGAKNAVASTP